MKYYSPAAIQSKLTNITENEQERDFINDILRTDNFYQRFNLKEILFTCGREIRHVIDENQVNKLNLFLTLKDKKYSLTDALLKRCEVKHQMVKSFPYNDHNDFSNAQILARDNDEYRAYKQEKQMEKDSRVEEVRKMGTVENKDLSKQLVVVIDFEFLPNVQDKFHLKQILEAGISIIRNGTIETYHYIVDENKDYKTKSGKTRQESFSFGTSEYIPYEQLRSVLNNTLALADVLVMHEHSTELAYFDRNKIAYDHLKIYDTQIMYRYNFKNDDEPDSKRLKDLLDDNMIIHKNLHNAGHDSHYTAMLFKKMVRELEKEEEKQLRNQKFKAS